MARQEPRPPANAPLSGLLVLAAFVMAAPGRAAEEVPLSARPYRVTVEVRWPRGAVLGGDVRTALIRAIRETGDRIIGRAWEITFQHVEDSALDPLGRWSESQIPAKSTFDKWFEIAIADEPAGFSLEGLEWDALVRSRSRAVRRSVRSSEELPEAVWGVIRDAFRPVAEVQRTRDGSFRLEARAGQLAAPDPAFRPLQGQGLWEPNFRFLGPDKTLLRIQAVPWTYLTTQDTQEGRAGVTIVSGLRNPLAGKSRRIETVALRISPAGEEAQTRLTLRNRGNVTRPQAGLEVRVLRDEKKPPAAVLVADRLGAVIVPRLSNSEPVWLHVFSGQELLAKVPFVAGVQNDQVLDLPDDSVRLKVEGEITLLQADLIDAVARRATLMATARAKAKAGDVPGVQATLKEIGELRKPESFSAELTSIRLNGVQTARARKNRAAEVRIQKLCQETQDLLTAYLSPDRVKQLEEEADELRLAAADSKESLAALAEKKKKAAAVPAKPAKGSRSPMTPPPTTPAPVKASSSPKPAAEPAEKPAPKAVPAQPTAPKPQNPAPEF